MIYFWILTVASVISKFGDKLLLVALPWAVSQTTDSPGLAIITLAISNAPYIFSPLLGGIIDRYDQRKVFACAQLFQALCISIVPWFLSYKSILAVLIVLFVSGISNVISNLTSDYGLIPSIVPSERLDWAYSRYSTIIQMAKFVSPVIAGILIASVGSAWAIWLDALTFLFTAASALIMPAANSPRPRGVNIFEFLREGLRAFMQQRDIQSLTRTLSVYNLGTGNIDTALIAVASTQWAWKAQWVGLTISMASLASVLGAWGASHLFRSQTFEHRVQRWLGICAFGATAFLLPKAVGPLLGFCILSFGVGGLNVNTVLYRQKSIPQELVGRVNSIVRMFVAGAVGMSGLILSAFSAASSSTVQFLPAIITPLLAFLLWQRHLRTAKMLISAQKATNEEAFESKS
jgi:MFS family permease